jgi:hypothetical protein
MEITTNNRPRKLNGKAFKYRGRFFHLDNFKQARAVMVLLGWHGVVHNNRGGGIAIKLTADNSHVIVGRF